MYFISGICKKLKDNAEESTEPRAKREEDTKRMESKIEQQQDDDQVCLTFHFNMTFLTIGLLEPLIFFLKVL
jgi:hypothetical protein